MFFFHNARPRRSSQPTATSLTINEPVRDLKGKKRAAPEPNSEEENTGPSAKRPRTSQYSLRSTTAATQATSMPKKIKCVERCLLIYHRSLRSPYRSPNAKGKMAIKAKMSMAGSSKVEDDDADMLNAENKHEDSDSDKIETREDVGDGPVVKTEDAQDAEPNIGGGEGGGGDEDGEEEEEEEDNVDGDGGLPSSDGPAIPGGMDEASAMAIFGDYRQFGSYMMSLSSRLKTMLNNIKSSADPTTRMVTLQELSELLSISTEDTLAGSFQVESFVRELVKILGGRGVDEDEDDDGDDEAPEPDEDAALAAALAMSTGNTYQGDDNLEAQVLACRCLANLMEALPGVAHTVVYHGAIPVLCSKLIEISYIDLAEQTLSVGPISFSLFIRHLKC